MKERIEYLEVRTPKRNYKYKIIKSTTNPKFGDYHKITIPEKLVKTDADFFKSNFAIYREGDKIILESGCNLKCISDDWD